VCRNMKEERAGNKSKLKKENVLNEREKQKEKRGKNDAEMD